MVIFYKKWKKYNEIQLTNNKMDLNNQKIKNHPSSPEQTSVKTHMIYIFVNYYILRLISDKNDIRISTIN